MAPIPSNVPSADQVAVSPVKPVGPPTMSIPVTINGVLLDVVALAQEAVREKFGPFPYGAEVAVNEVTHIGTPYIPTAPYHIILYVPKGKDQQTFYEAYVAVDKPGAPPRLTSPPVELPGTYLLKKRESSTKPVTHDVTSRSYPTSAAERRAYEFALQQLKKKLTVPQQNHTHFLKAEQLADINFFETEWRFTIGVSGPNLPVETWQVVVKESILSPLRLWLVSITQLYGQAVAKPPTQLKDGGYEDVPVTLPLHVGLDRAVIFAVNAFKQAKDPKSVLVKINQAETQVVNGTNWRLNLTFSDLVPLKEDQTFIIQLFEANDGIFKLTSINPLPVLIVERTEFWTTEYYLSFFATAAANEVPRAVSQLKKRSLRLISILSVTEVLPSGVPGDYKPTWVFKLILQDEKTGEEFLGIATVATDFTQAPLPLRFVSWEDLPAPGSQSGTVMSGGFKSVKVDLPAVQAAAGFATSALSTILTGLPGRATLSGVDSADEQVVDGVNWRLTLEVELAQQWPAGGGLGPVVLPTKFEVLVNQTTKKEYKLMSWNIVNAAQPGGYRSVPVGLPAVQDAAKFAAGALPKLLPNHHRPAELLRVESAEEQVVDGRNWRLKIVVAFAPDTLSYKYEVLVFQGDGCKGYTLKSANQIPE